MTVANALAFIDRGLDDHELRMRLNAAPDSSQLQKVLSQEELLFSADEFDQAYHHRLTQCQSEEESERVKEYGMWWGLLCQSFAPEECAKQCGGGCC